MCELSPIPFHGDTIFCIEHEGQPFAPMRPIIENMGLSWQTQARKLRENKERWGVFIMNTPSEGGEQQTLCMPVRKLPAFLASINPKKVRPELREKIELYQAECDDALWAYWTEGRAERKPQYQPEPVPTANAPLTPDQQCTLKSVVKGKIEAIPEADRPKGLYPQVWSRFNNHFRIARYSQLPQCRLSEAIEYLIQMDVMPKKELPTTDLKPLSQKTLDSIIELGFMPYDPSPISHVYSEDRELNEMFRTLRSVEGQMECMVKAKQMPPIPAGRENDVKKLREAVLASCFVARRALAAIFELGRQARREKLALAQA